LGNETICWKNQSKANPFEEIGDLRRYWQNPGSIDINEPWKALDGLFWICGNRAYDELMPRWRGSCTIGIIQPAFFLLPKEKGSHLGKPL
ncbi:ENR1 protein, partial [Baryphthengus martii]|nr:ENR1 protein [Baryphthengus martii]